MTLKENLQKKRASIKTTVYRVDKRIKALSVPKTVTICLFLVITLLLFLLALKGYSILNRNLLNAIEKGDIHAVQGALKNGANVNARISENPVFQRGTTALMLATIKEHPDIVKVLLENGANVDTEDANGKTALGHASESTRPYADVIKTLLEYAKEGKHPSTLKTLFEHQKAENFKWTEKDLRQALAAFYVKHHPVFWGCNSDPSTPPTQEEIFQCLDYQTFLETGWGRCSIINYAFQKYTGLKEEGRYIITSLTDYLTINGLYYADHDVTILPLGADKEGHSQYALIDSSLGWVITCSGLSPDDCIQEWGKRTGNYHISGTKDKYTVNGWNTLKFLINDRWSVTDNAQGETIPKPLQNSPSDGSVSLIKHYLKTTLHNPESVQYVEWSNVIENENKYLVRCKYRAKDDFGEYILNDHVFVMTTEAQVVDVLNYNVLRRHLNI